MYRKMWHKCLHHLRHLPCPVPPGCHRGLWTAQSEPPPRCPTLLVEQSIEPLWRRARPISDQNMVLTIRMEEEEGWPTGTWQLGPQVRRLLGTRCIVLKASETQLTDVFMLQSGERSCKIIKLYKLCMISILCYWCADVRLNNDPFL